MKVTPDANVLVRLAVVDNPEQSKAALAAVVSAELVAITTPALCELVWVLSRGYKRSRPDIARFIRVLREGANVVLDEEAVDRGLSFLDLGGDFADGVIAHEGVQMEADVFLSFDVAAVRMVRRQGFLASSP